MTILHDLKAGKNAPEEINVVIEIPKGSDIKYEIDEETGALFVDRKLFTAMFYPCNYGFVPQTKEKDGDPVDVRKGSARRRGGHARGGHRHAHVRPLRDEIARRDSAAGTDESSYHFGFARCR